MERKRMGRNGSPAANRAAKGARTSSTNCWLFAYCFEATECPSMRQTMSGAKTSVIRPRPRRALPRTPGLTGVASPMPSDDDREEAAARDLDDSAHWLRCGQRELGEHGTSRHSA